MALEDYTLGSIRSRLAEEFGINIDVQENADIIDKRINDAGSWIANRRKNWPWLEKSTVLDVGEPSTSLQDDRYGAGIFYKMQRTVTNCVFSRTALIVRELVDFTGSGLDATMATAYGGTTMTLEKAYTGSPQICTITGIVASTSPTVITINLLDSDGASVAIPSHVTTFTAIISGVTGTGTLPNGTLVATRVSNTKFSVPVNTSGSTFTLLGTAQISREFRIVQGYFPLPQDFINAESVHSDLPTNWTTLKYMDPTSFERRVRASKLSDSLNTLYTVIPDPLNIDDIKYLVVYPYYNSRNILHVKYFGDIRKLVGDNDIPDIPRSDRFLLWYASAWFVAQWQKDTDMVAFYRDGALGELQRMSTEYQLSDDLTQDADMEDDSLGPIQGPHNFPKFSL
jgi:hypothetical protein